jgi:putative SOS response-associated peptidase YedK
LPISEAMSGKFICSIAPLAEHRRYPYLQLMCGRFTREFTWEEVNSFLSVLSAPRNLQPRYNIAPTTLIDVVRLDGDGRRELVPMRWGLVPWFHKGTLKEFRYPTFNACVETVATTPSFKGAFGNGRRCIIPISGFYEWTGDKKDRQHDCRSPFRLRRRGPNMPR